MTLKLWDLADLRAVSPQRLLEPDDPVFAWRERVLDLHGGLARRAQGYPVWA